MTEIETAMPRVCGDDIKSEEDMVNPFHLEISGGLVSWMTAMKSSIALTTYSAGKIIIAGPNNGKITVSERNFGRAMAMLPIDEGILLSTRNQIWRFENGLKKGRMYEGWDKIFLPRRCHVTGAVDTHDLAYGNDNKLYAAITLYNCIAAIEESGSFSPVWKPPFIDAMVGEDRCHLNGFCMENGELAYATVIAQSNMPGGWREHRADGGMVIDVRTNEVVVDGLSMPHSPRMHDGKLWVLEAGRGYLGFVDIASKAFKPVAWCPGFVRGLRFYGGFALVGVSKPRDKTFHGLPLDGELEKRGMEPVCGVYLIRLSDGEIVHKVNITGSVEELFDVGIIPNALAPTIVGLEGSEINRWINLGEDRS